MFMYMSKRKGQSTLEYAILIGVVVAALIAMQVYIKRSLQGKLRDNADNIGKQFNPEGTVYNYTTNSFSNSTEASQAGVTNTSVHKQTSDKTGTENVDGVINETLFSN